MINALFDFIHTHPLLAAAIFLVAMLSLDVLLGAGDALLRGEYSWAKLPQVLKTKLYANPYARALLGLLAAAWLAKPEGQSLQDFLVAVLAAATALYSAPIAKDVVQKVAYIAEDLLARLGHKTLPARV